MSIVTLRTKMIMTISENTNQVRQTLGKKPLQVELENAFETMLSQASDNELLDLVIHSTKDVMIQKAKVKRA